MPKVEEFLERTVMMMRSMGKITPKEALSQLGHNSPYNCIQDYCTGLPESLTTVSEDRFGVGVRHASIVWTCLEAAKAS